MTTTENSDWDATCRFLCQNLESPKVNLIQLSANKARVVLQEETITEPTSRECPVDLSHVTCTPEQKRDLENLLTKHANVFAKNDNDLGSTDTYTHKIPTIDEVPVTQPYRRIPPSQYQEVKEHIQKLLDAGIIKESYSPYASQIVIVKKKCGSIRLCVDYHQLNSKTVRDSFPLPGIEESLDAVGNAKWFSTLDLVVGLIKS